MVLHTISNKLKLLGKKENSQIFKLDKIPGIGKKIQERLKEFYLTEENALNAIKVGAVGCVPGICAVPIISIVCIVQKIVVDEVIIAL